MRLDFKRFLKGGGKLKFWQLWELGCESLCPRTQESMDVLTRAFTILKIVARTIGGVLNGDLDSVASARIESDVEIGEAGGSDKTTDSSEITKWQRSSSCSLAVRDWPKLAETGRV